MSMSINIHDVTKIIHTKIHYPKSAAGPFCEIRFQFYNANEEMIACISGISGINCSEIVLTSEERKG